MIWATKKQVEATLFWECTENPRLKACQIILRIDSAKRATDSKTRLSQAVPCQKLAQLIPYKFFGTPKAKWKQQFSEQNLKTQV